LYPDEAIDSGLIYGKLHPDDIEEFIREKEALAK
jgi:hypothetical protein